MYQFIYWELISLFRMLTFTKVRYNDIEVAYYLNIILQQTLLDSSKHQELLPSLNDIIQSIQVTHSKCYFKTNDGNHWLFITEYDGVLGRRLEVYLNGVPQSAIEAGIRYNCRKDNSFHHKVKAIFGNIDILKLGDLHAL